MQYTNTVPRKLRLFQIYNFNKQIIWRLVLEDFCPGQILSVSVSRREQRLLKYLWYSKIWKDRWGKLGEDVRLDLDISNSVQNNVTFYLY